jgi:hypothetical protein
MANRGNAMDKYVFVSERGNDKHDGLDESRPGQRVTRAMQISLKTGRQIKVVDYTEGRPSKEQRQAP